MKVAKISKGGQISIPAKIRRRWAAESVVIEDQGNRLVLYPVPADPVAAFEGAFPLPRGGSERGREQLRREEEEIEDRRYRRYK